ncbi:MAG: PilZ domain-containing protein [Kofleriaceae bacterium]
MAKVSMDWNNVPTEWRHTVRLRVKGSAAIAHGERIVRGRIIDLGLGGLSIWTDEPSELTTLDGHAVRIQVTLDGLPRAEFLLRGHVVRTSGGARLIAITFDHLPRPFIARMTAELAAAVSDDVAPRMILVDGIAGRREVIADAFRTAGCNVTEVSSPLEAIARLEEFHFEPALIAIADTLPSTVAEELRDFMHGEHPEAHMVAIGRSAANRDPSGTWLKSTDGHDDLQLRVDRVMIAHRSRQRSNISGDGR